MSQFKDHFSSASNNYKTYRPNYPSELFTWLASQCKDTSSVWDCGTGSGQAAIEHSIHFSQVLATDASDAQIKQAEPRNNITYKVSPAEDLDVPDNSFDLITVAQAIHWFNLPKFFKTVDRVLKPGGLLAIWGYQFIHTDTEIDKLISHFHSNIVGPYWPTERKLLNEGYKDISFPYKRLPIPEFSMQVTWNLSQLTGYLDTWSAVKEYERINNHNPTKNITDQLEKLWGKGNETKSITWPLIMYLGKK